jgi:hypothetical protein
MPTLTKLNDTEWQLQVRISSTLIESLSWEWTAKVHVPQDSANGEITLGPSKPAPIGMPPDERLGSSSYGSRLTNGVANIPSNEFEDIMNDWQKECQTISSELDTSIRRARADDAAREAREQARKTNQQATVDYLDSLILPPANSTDT